MTNASTTAAPEPRRRIRLNPAVRRLEILRAAHRLLIDDGYAAFSLRQVAARCDIRLATVQHHFRDRSTLLEALVEYVVSDYTAKHDQIAAVAEMSPAERLRFMIRHLLDDNRRRETSGFMLELWAMAHRDAVAARSMAQVSRHGIAMLSVLIADARPSLTPRRVAELATILIAAIDGLILTFGYRKRPPAALGANALPGLAETLAVLALDDASEIGASTPARGLARQGARPRKPI